MWPGLLPVVEEIALEERRVGGVHQRMLCSVEERSAPLLLHKPFDELPPGEGAFFLACNFWLIDNCILQGRHAEARSLFDRLLSRFNDVGLLAEQIDPSPAKCWAIFPRLIVMSALINSALSMSREIGPLEERAEPQEAPITGAPT
jgi:hypothetical protein